MSAPRGGRGFARGELLAAGFLLAVVLLFLGSSLFGDDCLVTANMSRWLPWRISATADEMARPSFRDDAALTYFPRRDFSGDELRAGRVPLWNRYVLCGAPHLADFQSCVFHPLNVLLLYWVDPLWAMGTFVAVHLFLGGLFLFLLLRRFGVGVAGSLVGGLSFLLNAYFATYLGHPVHISTGVWVPLLLLVAHHRLAGGAALAFPVVVAMTILGGFPQTVLYGFLVAGAFALFQWAGLPAGEKRRGAAGLVALGALAAIGAGLTLFQLLPTAELGAQSERQVIPLAEVLAHHMPIPAELVRMVLPGFFGNPVGEDSWIAALKGPLPHPSDTGFLGYGGVIPLLLAFAAPFVSRRRERWFFTGLAAVSLLLLFAPPFYALFYRLVPFARFSTEVHRLQFPFLLATAALAGLGFDGIARRATEGRWRGVRSYVFAWLLTLPLGAAALAFGGPAILHHASNRLVNFEATEGAGAMAASLPPGARLYLAGDEPAWMSLEWNGFARYAILLAIGGGAILLLPRRGRVASAATALLVLSVAADLLLFAGDYATPQPKAETFAPHPLLRELAGGDEAPFRVARVGREYLLPSNTAEVYGIEDLQGVDALMPADLGRLFEAAHPALWPDKRRVPPFDDSMGDVLDLPLWSLLNVRYFLVSSPTPSGAEGTPVALGGHESLPFVRRGFLPVAENRDVLPRAFLRHRFEVVPDRAEILARVTSPAFDPAGPLLLEREPGLAPGTDARIEGDECVIAPREGANVSIRTSSREPGLLFLGETWYPGWEATVDGGPAPILRADFAFRAVPLPAGEHRVEFRYRPASFRRGVTGSLVALALYLVVTLAAMRRRGHISR